MSNINPLSNSSPVDYVAIQIESESSQPAQPAVVARIEDFLQREEYRIFADPLQQAEGQMRRALNERNITLDEHFYRDVAFLLAERGKLEFSPPKDLLEQPHYRTFSERVDQLQRYAEAHVDEWYNKNRTEQNLNTVKWIKADKNQLKFAAYSHEIVPKAEDVPIGAVLLFNPEAARVSDMLRGHSATIKGGIQKVKSMLCGFMTGLPLTHAMVSLGGGRFIHIDKENEATGVSSGGCSGEAILEDHSNAARADRREAEVRAAREAGKEPPPPRPAYRCMYNFEIMVPNYRKMAQTLRLEGNDPKRSVERYLAVRWAPLLEASVGVTKTPFRTIAAAAFNSNRPENYDPTTVFKPAQEGGYSCSGFIGSSFGAVNIDVGREFDKRVEKMTPGDYVSSSYFEIGYSNNRVELERVRRDVQESREEFLYERYPLM